MITAQMIVKNEDRFVWYSVMSVIDYVDEFLIWDMGSSDLTVEIIEELMADPRTANKIRVKHFAPKKTFDEQFYRQKMLEESKGDWFIVVDGDEIWWKESISSVVAAIKTKGQTIESIVVPTINLVGDMFHRQEDKAGHYRLAGRVGHYNLRAVNSKIPGLKAINPHGLLGWADDQNLLIQNRDQSKIHFIDGGYLHASFLNRSSFNGASNMVYKRSFKYKHEIGISLAYDYFYPEVFFVKRPEIVPFVFEPMKFNFKIRALALTPLRKFKRRVLPTKEGY